MSGLTRQTVGGHGRIYRLPITVEHYGDVRAVEVVFAPYARDPKITTDGPSDSPHRYGDGSLCLWHPSDPPEQRWELRDGLFTLIGLIRIHLFAEAWWREFDVWPLPEAPHAPAKEAPTEEAA